jgi:hypothetical protein
MNRSDYGTNCAVSPADQLSPSELLLLDALQTVATYQHTRTSNSHIGLNFATSNLCGIQENFLPTTCIPAECFHTFENDKCLPTNTTGISYQNPIDDDNGLDLNLILILNTLLPENTSITSNSPPALSHSPTTSFSSYSLSDLEESIKEPQNNMTANLGDLTQTSSLENTLCSTYSFTAHSNLKTTAESKLGRIRGRNRISARKCRQRKKSREIDIEMRLEDLRRKNSDLRDEVKRLQYLAMTVQVEYINHIDCTDIKLLNTNTQQEKNDRFETK